MESSLALNLLKYDMIAMAAIDEAFNITSSNDLFNQILDLNTKPSNLQDLDSFKHILNDLATLGKLEGTKKQVVRIIEKCSVDRGRHFIKIKMVMMIHEGAFTEGMITVEDISASELTGDLQKKEDSLFMQGQQALFRNLYTESPLGILMICDLNAKILHANPKICKMLGYTERELKELTAYEITHPADRNKYKNNYEYFRAQQRYTFDFEKRYIRKDKTIIWVAIAVSVVQDTQGSGLYSLATVKDITEKYEAKEKIQEQLEIFNQQNQKLEQYIDSNVQLENFAYIASHDLKTPLRSIGSFAQLLDRRVGHLFGDAEKEYMAFIKEGVGDMNQLIDNLLMYSKIDAGENLVTLLNTQHILNNVCRNLDVLINEKQATIIIEEIPQQVKANKVELTQIFQNLIANSIKFQSIDNPPEIRIKGGEMEDHWAFQFSDNGIGIAPEYHEQIFTLFKRLHSRQAYDGSGIGLAYCKRVVEKHGGEIWLESAEGQGTTFFFTLQKKDS